MLEMEGFLEALKWGILVFIAGLIGYFGKYLGGKIISLFHKQGLNKTNESQPIHKGENEMP